MVVKKKKMILTKHVEYIKSVKEKKPVCLFSPAVTWIVTQLTLEHWPLPLLTSDGISIRSAYIWSKNVYATFWLHEYYWNWEFELSSYKELFNAEILASQELTSHCEINVTVKIKYMQQWKEYHKRNSKKTQCIATCTGQIR